jgi:site-specific DNA-methyltransferase (adenine-specific)
MRTATVIVGDNRETLKSLVAGSVQCVVTSPPYWGLRDYGEDDQIGLESTPEDYVEQLCQVFDEVWRVLANDGTLWLNLGDSYLNKSLAGIPWRVAFALQARGWYLRSDIIWHKPNPMPESVTDRPTKSHEYIFLLTKSAQYYYDAEAIKEPVVTETGGAGIRFGGTKYGDSDDPKHNTKSGNIYEGSETRNKRDVWTVATKPYSGAHFATYPMKLIEPCILAGSRDGDTVLDPFSGSGTTGIVAIINGRNYVGIELNPEYAVISEKRITDEVGFFGTVEIIK